MRDVLLLIGLLIGLFIGLFIGCSGTPARHAETPARRWTPYCCEGGSVEHPRGCVATLGCTPTDLAIECRPDDGCEDGGTQCHCCRARGSRACIPSSRTARRLPEPEPEPEREPEPDFAPTHRRSGTVWSPF